MLIKTDLKLPKVNPEILTIEWLASIYASVHINKFNFIGMIVGRHRVGKSLLACLLGYLLDKTFWPNFEKRVVYSAKQFMEALNDIAKEGIIGGVVVWDEAGVGIPARLWYDISNKSINFATQVFGIYRPIVWFVSQDITFIDSQPRKLLNEFYQMTRPSHNFAYLKPFNIQYDRKRGKIYFPYPKLSITWENKRGTKIKLKKVKIPRPFKELENRYIEHSKPFKDKIMQVMEERASRIESGEVGESQLSTAEVIEMVVENYKKYEGTRSKEEYKKLSSDLIRYSFKIPDGLARVVKIRAEQVLNEKTEV